MISTTGINTSAGAARTSIRRMSTTTIIATMISNASPRVAPA